MMTLLVIALAIGVVEVLAWVAGVDSTDGIDSPEWARRRTWRRGA